ncbi:MAG: MotA/TolQ/ExbB proton channel family protein [Bacteroidota bacterium]
MNIIESILLAISNLLYYPVLFGVLFVLVHQAFAVGKFLSELKQRRTKNFKQLKAFEARHSDYFKAPAPTYKAIEYDLVSKLREWHQNYSKSLNANRLVIKAGPSLGLLGTLIPMGTALASLSQGDLMVMSANMVTAFTTTVVGMFAGLTAFLLHYKQMEWMKKDLQRCEALCEKSLVEWEMTSEHHQKIAND